MNEQLKSTRWRVLRGVFATIFLLALLPVGLFAWIYFFHDGDNQPLCNKFTMGEVMNWLDRPGRIALPNRGGRSIESLAKLKQDSYELAADAEREIRIWNDKYQYIPGLQRGDPNDLVLMYMKHPTRWQNHATGTPSIFDERKWILVPLDFVGFGGSYCAENRKRTVADESECAERVPLDELKSRLRKTLDYLEKNNRPHWQIVVAENQEFLKSLEPK